MGSSRRFATDIKNKYEDVYQEATDKYEDILQNAKGLATKNVIK